ncbi:MAG: FecR family protein [Candidatus Omnitrophota bacterium]
MKIIRMGTVLVAAVIMCAYPAFSDTAVGKITYVEGRVDGHKAGDAAYFPLIAGEEVCGGDVVRTKSYSKAEITFNDGSVLRLGASSQVRVKEYGVSEAGDREKALVQLDRGKIRVIVAKAADKAAFRVATPNVSGSVKGSDIFVAYQMSATNILVAEGTFSVINKALPENMVRIKEGNAIYIPLDAMPENPRPYLREEQDSYESETGPVTEEKRGMVSEGEKVRAYVAESKGNVFVSRPGGKSPHEAESGEILNPGDKVETGDDGWVKIALDNGHVLELRQNTQIIVKKLRRDSDTGSYENLFECEYGKIKARLEKVPKGSSFLVKTPTAVCGVRGTIMYLDVMPDVTSAFFEGGDGFVESTVTGETETVVDGNTRSVDSKGDISAETGATDSQRKDFGSDWGSDKGDKSEYGYSKPDAGKDMPGALGAAATDEGRREDAKGRDAQSARTEAANAIETARREPFKEIQLTSNDITATNVLTKTITMNAAFGGSFMPAGRAGEANTADAGIDLEFGGNDWSGRIPVSVSGDYTKPEDTDVVAGEITGAVGSSGAIYGLMAAAGNGDRDGWHGPFAGFYVDPSGMCGTITGGLSGSHDGDDSGRFWGSGTLTAVSKGGAGITAGDLADGTALEKRDYTGNTMFGWFTDNTGSIRSDAADIRYANILNKRWGVYMLSATGTDARGGAEGSSSDDWYLVVGGVPSSTTDSEKLYWIGTMDGEDLTGGDNGPNNMQGGLKAVTFEGSDIDGSRTVGYATGKLVGDHEGEEWTGAVTGNWVELSELVDLRDLIDLTEELYSRIDNLVDASELVQVSDMISLSNLSGSFTGANGVIQNVNMDITMFGAAAGAADGFWTSAISGNYSGPTSDSWSIAHRNGSDNIDLNGFKWSDGEWFATVEGAMDNKDMAGTASGSYSDGSFSGNGAGVFKEVNNAETLQ